MRLEIDVLAVRVRCGPDAGIITAVIDTLKVGTHINVLDGADNGAMGAWAASMPA